uniref:Serpentine receptor class gamma n=1 Tax=Panagrolaimus davidi TaxID=227884 RepID=A0A914PN10_9BILA
MILGPWNTLMALNRFTAVWFWKRHSRIWRWKFVALGIFGMFMYPFILSINMIIKNSYCYIHPSDDEKCEKYDIAALFVGTISNGIHVIIAAVLGIITSLSSRCKIISVTPETRKFEQFLLLQSIISLILYGFDLYYTLTYNIEGDNTTLLRRVLNNLSESYYIFFRISSALLLFFLS